MKVYLVCDSNEKAVQVMATLTSSGGTKGHLRRVVRPGESFQGHSYESLMILGTGEKELADTTAMPRQPGVSSKATA